MSDTVHKIAPDSLDPSRSLLPFMVEEGRPPSDPSFS